MTRIGVGSRKEEEGRKGCLGLMENKDRSFDELR